MSAQRLRDAARVLRERAEAAPGGAWEPYRRHDRGAPSVNYTGVTNGGREPDHLGIFEDVYCRPESATYIATMHPGVGLALAKWLDDIASGWMWDDPDAVSDLDGWPLSLEESMDSHAVAIADLILGGTP